MNFSFHFSRSLWKVADWVYPPICAGCGKRGFRFCPDCFSKVTRWHGNFCLTCGTSLSIEIDVCPVCCQTNQIELLCASWARYEEPLRSAIHKLKYDDDQGLGDLFSQFLINLLEARKWKFDLIIPVPLSKKRFRERGYNQAELISRILSNYFQIAHSNDAVVRTKETETQFNLTPSERFRNVKDAFFGNPAKLRGRRVLVVDDIITTGATMLQCQQAILQAGGVACNGISIAKAGFTQY